MDIHGTPESGAGRSVVALMDVRWVDSQTHASPSGANEALRDQIAALLGPGEIVMGRLCPRCGSASHGRPWARHRDRDVLVSLSRSREHLVTAVSEDREVGIDVESVLDVAATWAGDVVLAPGEQAQTPLERARIWVAKEAVLKAYGVGLSRPMTDISVAEFDGDLTELEAPDGFVAAVALLR